MSGTMKAALQPADAREQADDIVRRAPTAAPLRGTRRTKLGFALHVMWSPKCTGWECRAGANKRQTRKMESLPEIHRGKSALHRWYAPELPAQASNARINRRTKCVFWLTARQIIAVVPVKLVFEIRRPYEPKAGYSAGLCLRRLRVRGSARSTKIQGNHRVTIGPRTRLIMAGYCRPRPIEFSNVFGMNWSGREDSNLRPLGPEPTWTT